MYRSKCLVNTHEIQWAGGREYLSRRINLLEESQINCVDGELTLPAELSSSVIEHFGSSVGAKIPWVAVVVSVLGITTGRNGCVEGDPSIDGVDATERVDVNLVAGKDSAAAGLVEGVVTAAVDVERLDWLYKLDTTSSEVSFKLTPRR